MLPGSVVRRESTWSRHDQRWSGQAENSIPAFARGRYHRDSPFALRWPHMTPFRLTCVLLLALACGSQLLAVEPWADAKLPVTDGLELWLDAGRIDEAAKANKEKLVDGKL